MKFTPWKKKRVQLHALGPSETWYQRCVDLVAYASLLRNDVMELKAKNRELQRMVNAGEVFTSEQDELQLLRLEVNALWRFNEKMGRKAYQQAQLNKVLSMELEEATAWREQAA
ncbi:MAG: hypothetical protein IPO17_13265 [Flavobacteriales bacterium]|nr:hypothetical protein [Flavobacteriales bacterium]MBK9195915.1 hypothetical protein [Flavobacteriales bacterium]